MLKIRSDREVSQKLRQEFYRQKRIHAMCEKVDTMMVLRDKLDIVQRENKMLTDQAYILGQEQAGQTRWEKATSKNLLKVEKEGRIPYGQRTYEKEKFLKQMAESGYGYTY